MNRGSVGWILGVSCQPMSGAGRAGRKQTGCRVSRYDISWRMKIKKKSAEIPATRGRIKRLHVKSPITGDDSTPWSVYCFIVSLLYDKHICTGITCSDTLHLRYAILRHFDVYNMIIILTEDIDGQSFNEQTWFFVGAPIS